MCTSRLYKMCPEKLRARMEIKFLKLTDIKLGAETKHIYLIYLLFFLGVHS